MRRRMGYNDAFWTIVGEACCIIALTPGLAVVKGFCVSGSWLVGGAVAVVPTVFFYRRVFSYFGAQQLKAIVNALYWGEALKFLLTGVGFVLAFQIPWLQPLWLFLGFLAANIAFWLASLVISLRRNKG